MFGIRACDEGGNCGKSSPLASLMLDIFVNPVATTLVSIAEHRPSMINGLLEMGDNLKYSFEPGVEYKAQYIKDQFYSQNSSGGLITLKPSEVSIPTLLDTILKTGVLDHKAAC